MSTSTAAYKKKGPWGNLTHGDIKDTGIFTRLIRFTAVVNNETGSIGGLSLEYMQDGVMQKTGFWGSGNGTAYEVTLGEGEFLVGIRATYDRSLRSLSLISNKQEYGPYGNKGSSAYSLTPDGVHKIVGFHGRSVGIDELIAIGVYMGPFDKLDECLMAREELEKTIAQLTAENTALKQEAQKAELAAYKKKGPWGNLTHGDIKDTGIFTSLIRFTAVVNNETGSIRGLNLEYMQNGVMKKTFFGGSGNGTAYDVTLEEGEFLVGIRATYDRSLRSLSLISNKQEYGPYGSKGSSAYSLTPDGVNKIVGFHGRTVGNDELIAIGVYTGPFDKLDECLKAREESEKRIAQLAAENTTLKQEVERAELVREESSKTIAQLAAENTTLKHEVEKAELVREESAKTIAQLAAENTALKHEVERAKLDHEQLAKENSSLKDEVEKRRKVPALLPMRIFTKVDESYSLTARNGKVILIKSDRGDQNQQWFRYNQDGSASFALVNAATSQAIQHVDSKKELVMAPYNSGWSSPGNGPALWMELKKSGSDGFFNIQSTINSRAIIDAWSGKLRVDDGAPLASWIVDSIIRPQQVWKIQPW